MAFTKAFVAIGTQQTFPLIMYWYGGLLNYLIPSGGGEWAVVAPYMIPAPFPPSEGGRERDALRP